MWQSGCGQADPFILTEGMETASRRIVRAKIGHSAAPAAARKAAASRLDFDLAGGSRMLRLPGAGATTGIKACHDHLAAFMAGR